MTRRRASSGATLWNTLSKIATRNVRRAQRTVTRSAIKSAVRQGEAMSQAAQRVLSGVASPAPAPVSRGGGRWEEGSGGLGPLVQRRYRLFIPSGVSASRPAPLLVLLHGCGQDSSSFAACTRAAVLARSARCVVLMPEQSSHANAQRCWNWFRSAARVAAEASLLMAIVDQVCQRRLVRADQVFALGLSAGGAMAQTLGLRYPDRFAAVGSHSGAVALSAGNAAQAARVMHGKGHPDMHAARSSLAGRRPPPLLLLHGDADHVVHFDNALAAAALWQQLLPKAPALAAPRRIQRGQRRPFTVFAWSDEGRPYLRLVRIEGLGHAWSGGASGQAFSDPSGPDALRIAWQFFMQCLAARGRVRPAAAGRAALA
ncbi:PHB depolymerase family esterase [Cupriavidus sp. 2TAF22]|uniref:extracellular catalytic domain type 1 short-chain-length polyhydroxyalkanoate depolymerase n=1 Tax=unclassified Cupriavidus TaxID=2640874 RepID=UPI003F8F005C